MNTHKKKKGLISNKLSESSRSQIKGDRIQKVLSRAGLGSRREIERWIEEGKLVLNGKVAVLGERLREGDRLQINGRIIQWEKYSDQPTRVLIYHKPTGEVVTRRDPEGRPVIFTQLPKLQIGRWVSIGRLDINSQGLLLVTNNGELAHRLMHPSTEIQREYAVRIFGNVSNEIIDRLKQGVELEDGEARFDEVEFSGGEGINKWYRVTVSEGRNRLVRRLWETQDVVVNRLMRVRYGPVDLPDRLKARTFYELNDKEIMQLMQSVEMKIENPAGKSLTSAPRKRKH